MSHSCLFYYFFSFTSSPVQRSQLIKCYYSHVQSLVRHKEAIELVELAYNDYANASERFLLIQEFYGPQFAVFKDGSGQSLLAILSAHPEEKGKLIGCTHSVARQVKGWGMLLGAWSCVGVIMYMVYMGE